MTEKEILDLLILKTKEEGIKLCKYNKYTPQIVREDLNNYAITCDFRFDRINLSIDNGLITRCDIG